MNKVYKVIWSKVKNCYVVVSELARRNGKASSSAVAFGKASGSCRLVRIVASGVVLAGLLTVWCAPVIPAEAGTVRIEATEANQVVAGTANATGENAVAIGKGTSAEGNDAVAIGGAKSQGQNALSIGAGADSTGDNTVSIGNSAKASAASAIALGGNAGGNGALALGYGTQASERSATAVGYDASARGQGSLAAGASAIAWVILLFHPGMPALRLG